MSFEQQLTCFQIAVCFEYAVSFPHVRLFGHLLLLIWLFSTLSLTLWECIYGKCIHQHIFQYMFQYVFPCDTSNNKCSSKFRFQLTVNSFCSEILSIAFCGMWFMWYLTCSMSFYELNQYYNKNGVFLIHGMQ